MPIGLPVRLGSRRHRASGCGGRNASGTFPCRTAGPRPAERRVV